MTNQEFEFILFDRIEKIKSINEQYNLEDNSYIAFSGGKDSRILHQLVDLALPNNHIPRVFSNTGIEYQLMVKYVKNLALNDDRIIILAQTKNIRRTLEEYGYPFKSKEHSEKLSIYQSKVFKSKTVYKYLKVKDFGCPSILKYQFNPNFKLKISKKCCLKLKKELSDRWAKDNNRKIKLTGIRKEEGGQRATRGSCTIFKENNLKSFNPLFVIDNEFEEEFIKRYNIRLCDLYYPPYNFKRTGCKGCPFNLNLQEDLIKLNQLLPNEYKQCINLWKPVYDEYIRIGYRLKEYPHLILKSKKKKLF